MTLYSFFIIGGVVLLGFIPVGLDAALDKHEDVSVRLDVKIVGNERQGFWQQLAGWLGVRRLAYVKPEVGSEFTVNSTAYAPSPYQTDSTPCITAAGTKVRKGTVATNMFPLGTLLEINGEVYIVEDRMNARFKNSVDVFFPSTSEALEFGKQKLEIKVVGYGEPGQELPREQKAKVEIEIINPTQPVQKKPKLAERLKSGWNDVWISTGEFLGIRNAVDVNRFDVDCLQEN